MTNPPRAAPAAAAAPPAQPSGEARHPRVLGESHRARPGHGKWRGGGSGRAHPAGRAMSLGEGQTSRGHPARTVPPAQPAGHAAPPEATSAWQGGGSCSPAPPNCQSWGQRARRGGGRSAGPQQSGTVGSCRPAARPPPVGTSHPLTPVPPPVPGAPPRVRGRALRSPQAVPPPPPRAALTSLRWRRWHTCARRRRARSRWHCWPVGCSPPSRSPGGKTDGQGGQSSPGGSPHTPARTPKPPLSAGLAPPPPVPR